jgi:hypothetical protein
MDANPDDLNDLERRLLSCKPAADGLDAEAMLFAAGRAVATRATPGFVWPVLACCMTALSAVLGIWLQSERDEKHMLAQRLSQQSPMQTPAIAAPVVAFPIEPVSEESPDSVHAARRALESGSAEDWVPRATPRGNALNPPSENLHVLQVGQRDTFLDQ